MSLKDVIRVKYGNNPYPIYDQYYAKEAGALKFDAMPFCKDVERVDYEANDKAMSHAVNEYYQARAPKGDSMK